MKKDWEIKRLGDYCKIRTGKLDANAACENGRYPFFTCSVTPLKINSYSFDCECVLVAGNGDLNVKYYEGKFDAYQRTYIIESVDKTILDVHYLYSFLSSYIDELRKQSIGAIIKYIKLGNLTEAPIPIPPLEEQKRIVKILDEKFAQLETIKTNAKTNLQNAKDLFQSQLSQAFEQKDCHTDSGLLTQSPKKDFKDFPLGKSNPCGNKWKTVRLGDFCDTCLGKMLDKNKNKGTPQPYLANINVRWGSFDLEKLSLMKFEDNENERYGLQKGDLIICEGGEPGRCAIWNDEIPNMKIQKALHRVRCHNNLSNYYLYYWFVYISNANKLEEYFTGTTIKHLPGEKLKSLKIPLPPLLEQKRIVKELDTLSEKTKALCAIYEKQIADCEELKKSLLAKAFEGNL